MRVLSFLLVCSLVEFNSSECRDQKPFAPGLLRVVPRWFRKLYDDLVEDIPHSYNQPQSLIKPPESTSSYAKKNGLFKKIVDWFKRVFNCITSRTLARSVSKVSISSEDLFDSATNKLTALKEFADPTGKYTVTSTVNSTPNEPSEDVVTSTPERQATFSKPILPVSWENSMFEEQITSVQNLENSSTENSRESEILDYRTADKTVELDMSGYPTPETIAFEGSDIPRAESSAAPGSSINPTAEGPIVGERSRNRAPKIQIAPDDIKLTPVQINWLGKILRLANSDLQRTPSVRTIRKWLETTIEDYLFIDEARSPKQSDRSQRICKAFGFAYVNHMNKGVLPLSKHILVTFDAPKLFSRKGRIFFGYGGIRMDTDVRNMRCLGFKTSEGWELHYEFDVAELTMSYQYEINFLLGTKVGVIDVALGKQKMHAKMAVVKTNETCVYHQLGWYLDLDIRKYEASFNESKYSKDFENDPNYGREFDWRVILNTLLVNHMLLCENLSVINERNIFPVFVDRFRRERGHDLCQIV